MITRTHAHTHACLHAHIYTHTHKHFTALWILSRTTQVSLFPQSFSKFSLIYFLAWHSQLHTPYISLPSHSLLFAAHANNITTCFVFLFSTEIMSSNPSLSLNPFTWNSILQPNATHPSNYSHLWPLKCHLIFLSRGPGLTSMQHTTLHTTAVLSTSH